MFVEYADPPPCREALSGVSSGPFEFSVCATWLFLRLRERGWESTLPTCPKMALKNRPPWGAAQDAQITENHAENHNGLHYRVFASDGILRPQDGPKTAQESPKRGPRWPQEGPKSAQAPQERPKRAPRGNFSASEAGGRIEYNPSFLDR